ncbi:MAG: tetratricopeptide repeat protein, partial [Candidatus Omnitrophica bacterium]|nr:tetratricopeptide repeat protein [Candidatus Omnitrophota bacterium]
LVENKVKGNFFNDFNSGAYLIGRTYPNIKPFIDGRTEVYGSEFFTKQYLKLWGEGESKLFDELSAKYNFTGAFLNFNIHQIPDKTAVMFSEKKEWVPVYFDRDAMIMLKDIPQNKELINRFRIDFKTWVPPEFNLKKLGVKPIFPAAEINRGFTLFAFKEYDLVLKEMESAEKIYPQAIEIYKLRGKVYEKQKKYQLAFINYRIACSMAPTDSALRGKLGVAYENIGDYEHAIEQFEKSSRNSPTDATNYYSMARVFARMGKIEKARQFLRKAVGMAPDSSVELVEIGDIMFQQKVYDRALVIYQKALYGGKELAEIHYKIGRTHLVMRNVEQARKHFERSLALDSKGPFAKKCSAKLSKLSADPNNKQ